MGVPWEVGEALLPGHRSVKNLSTDLRGERFDHGFDLYLVPQPLKSFRARGGTISVWLSEEVFQFLTEPLLEVGQKAIPHCKFLHAEKEETTTHFGCMDSGSDSDSDSIDLECY